MSFIVAGLLSLVPRAFSLALEVGRPISKARGKRPEDEVAVCSPFTFPRLTSTRPLAGGGREGVTQWTLVRDLFGQKKTGAFS